MFQMINFNAQTPEAIINHRLAMIKEREQGTKIDSILEKFAVTRPTFYKFYNRYHQFGKVGLHNLSKAPKNHGRKTSQKEEKRLEELFIQHPYFSSYELRELTSLIPRTIQRILKRKNLQKVYKPKKEKKKLLEKLKKELQQKRRQKK